jgi:hypothetical protein
MKKKRTPKIETKPIEVKPEIKPEIKKHNYKQLVYKVIPNKKNLNSMFLNIYQ